MLRFQVFRFPTFCAGFGDSFFLGLLFPKRLQAATPRKARRPGDLGHFDQLFRVEAVFFGFSSEALGRDFIDNLGLKRLSPGTPKSLKFKEYSLNH